MDREYIFRELYKNQIKRDNYLDKVPSDINMFFVQNEYVNSLEIEREKLIRFVFGEFSYSIEWFLYEWKSGQEVVSDGITTEIHNIDQYIDWMKLNGQL